MIDPRIFTAFDDMFDPWANRLGTVTKLPGTNLKKLPLWDPHLLWMDGLALACTPSARPLCSLTSFGNINSADPGLSKFWYLYSSVLSDSYWLILLVSNDSLLFTWFHMTPIELSLSFPALCPFTGHLPLWCEVSLGADLSTAKQMVRMLSQPFCQI